jgi:thiol:disulfide interchange protein
MKSILFFFLLVLAAFAIIAWSRSGTASPYEGAEVSSGANGIAFVNPSWQEALVKAKDENKLVFLDAYASWCGPCKMLKKQTFPDKAAGDFFNEHFISVAIDMEKGDGPGLAEKYRVSAYPTLIITDADGNPITYTKGFMGPKDLIAFGKDALIRSGK